MHKRCAALRHRSVVFLAVPVLVAALLLPAVAGAAHLPRWELGVGSSALRLPAYRGAEGATDYLLPFPHVVYRGEQLRVDEEGVRGLLLATPRTRFDISLGGNLPVDSDQAAAREGMPALDPLGEIGPSLEVLLWRPEVRHAGHDTELWLRLPLRAAFSVGDPLLSGHGWIFSPGLSLVHRFDSDTAMRRLSLTLGPLYATQRYHDYFYTVSPAYATPEREIYAPPGGYSGYRLSLGLTMNRDKWFFGAFIRHDNLAGAVFAGSPLVETTDYFVVALAVSRILLVSDERLPHVLDGHDH